MVNALQSRNSALAVLEEVTEGTPVAPSLATDYVALQSDFTLTPDIEVLTNEELRASIGAAPPILGAENPAGSFSHYLRSSNVEGTAPNYGKLLKAALGGERTIGSRPTVDSSTTTATTLGVGQGANVSRGDGFIILDPVNGRSIRNVASITGDVITWDFALENAPANGVELSRFVTYYPVNTGHPTLSIWHYIANEGAVALATGVRPVTCAVSAAAGQLLNVNYSLEGLEYFLNPIEITATTKFIDFTDDDGTFAASVAERYYKDPNDLAEALETAMNATATTQTYTVEYVNRDPDSGKFVISNTTGALLDLEWNTGANAANTIGAKLGFSTAADDTGSLSYTSDSAQDYSSPQTPTFDDEDPNAGISNELLLGDADQNFCLVTSTFTVNVDMTRTIIEDLCADSGRAGSLYSARSIPATITTLLEKNDADKFHKYHSNSTVALAYHWGKKVGGEWQVGQSGSIYIPTAKISGFEPTDLDGLVAVNLSVNAFVNQDGEGEVYFVML